MSHWMTEAYLTTLSNIYTFSVTFFVKKSPIYLIGLKMRFWMYSIRCLILLVKVKRYWQRSVARPREATKIASFATIVNDWKLSVLDACGEFWQRFWLMSNEKPAVRGLKLFLRFIYKRNQIFCSSSVVCLLWKSQFIT